jgi:hypothetical protein
MSFKRLTRSLRSLSVAMLLMLLIVFVATPTIALSVAGTTSQTVTVTGYPYVVASPTDLHVVVVNNGSEADVSWVKGVDPVYPGMNAANTMIRAKIGSDPKTITDGYLVYYGAGTTAVDLSASVATAYNTGETIYYAAWSQSSSGVFENDLFRLIAFVRGAGMILLVLVLLALGTLTLAYIFKRTPLYYASMMSWVVFGIFCMQESTMSVGGSGALDIYYVLFWLGCGVMPLFCVAEAIGQTMSNRRASGGGNPSDDETEDEVSRFESDWDNSSSRTPRIGKRATKGRRDSKQSKEQ